MSPSETPNRSAAMNRWAYSRSGRGVVLGIDRYGDRCEHPSPRTQGSLRLGKTGAEYRTYRGTGSEDEVQHDGLLTGHDIPQRDTLTVLVLQDDIRDGIGLLSSGVAFLAHHLCVMRVLASLWPPFMWCACSPPIGSSWVACASRATVRARWCRRQPEKGCGDCGDRTADDHRTIHRHHSLSTSFRVSALATAMSVQRGTAS